MIYMNYGRMTYMQTIVNENFTHNYSHTYMEIGIEFKEIEDSTNNLTQLYLNLQHK